MTNHSQVTCIVHKRPNCLLEFEASAFKELISLYEAKALKILAKGLSLPGFRKGKVPDNFILQRFPKELKEKCQEIAVGEVLQECFKQTDIKPIDKDNVRFKVHGFSPDELKVSFFFEVEPTIPHVDPALFKLKEVKKPVVDDSKVKETIRQVLFFYATWNKVEDRIIKEGDFLTLDVDLIEKVPPSALFTNTRFEVTDASMAKWMKDLLIGKKVGDVVEGISVPDEAVEATEKEAFKPQKVRITIKDMEDPILPELTPELLKNLGVESEEDFKKKIETMLQNQAEEHVKEEQRNQVKEFLLTQYPFDLPLSFIDKEVKFRVSQLNRNEEFLNHWRSLNQEEQKNTIDMIKMQSEKAVKLFHLTNQIVKEQNLSPSPHSLPKAPNTQLEALMNHNQMSDYHQDPALRRAEAMSKLMLEEAENYIIAQATSNVLG